MAEPYVGEIRLFTGSYAPEGWHLCDGTLLSISDYANLYSLIGTTFGGNGTSHFAVPDLRGRAAISAGQGPGLTNRSAGQSGGTETVTLTMANYPAHSHTVFATSAAAMETAPGPAVGLAAAVDKSAGQIDARYLPASKTPLGNERSLNPLAVSEATGGSQPLDNMMPSIALNYIIASQGVYPSQSSAVTVIQRMARQVLKFFNKVRRGLQSVWMGRSP